MKKFLGIHLNSKQYAFSLRFFLVYLVAFFVLVLIGTTRHIEFFSLPQGIVSFGGVLFSLTLLLSSVFSWVLVVFRLRNGEGVFRSALETAVKLGCAQFIASVIWSLLFILPLPNPDLCNPGFAGGMCDFDPIAILISLLFTSVLAVALVIFAGIYRLIFKHHNVIQSNEIEKVS